MYDINVGAITILLFLGLVVWYTFRHYQSNTVTFSLPRLNDKTVVKYFFRATMFIIVLGMAGFTHTAAGLSLLVFYALVEHATILDGREWFSPKEAE